jgi:hypothetical protein
MKKYCLGSLVAIVLFSPAGLWACDCGDDAPPAIVHFKDGLAPNGPVCGCDCSRGDASAYSDSFGFRDYGPVHITPPPAPPKRPTS